MDSIFPFIDPQEVEIEEEALPMAIEWAWDFEKLEFKLQDGRMYFVEGKEAVKIWVWKLFNSPRYRYAIYSWDYGHELEDLIGRGFSEPFIKSEAERFVREAIWPTLNGYVEDIKDLSLSVMENKLIISFTVKTPYGEVEMNV